jgi:hypothetical protein
VADVVELGLQVEVADAGHVEVLGAELEGLAVALPAVAGPHFA